MQTRRLIATLAAGLVAVAGLAGCRSSPNVAAYVGDEQVTVAELETALQEHRADPELTVGEGPAYSRRLLYLLVQRELYAAAAENYGVTVTDRDVQQFIDDLLAGQDPADALYTPAAADGLSREDVFELARQQLLRQRIAEAEGLAEGTSEEALRAEYEEIREGLVETQLGYINVPDQATADAVIAALTADPSSYPAVAAQFPSAITLPELTAGAQVPDIVAEQVAAAEPNTGFSVVAPDVPGVIVVFVGESVAPSYEELRPQLANEASAAAADAGGQEVAEFAEELGVTVNPRFGTWSPAGIQEAAGGVVEILGSEPAAAGGAPAGSGN